jgi:DedD protein
MAESEAQLELKKRARRRLVGAAALALAAVIVLPMVMDHEPKPLTQDIQIRIPSQDAPAALPSAPAKPNTAAPAKPPAEGVTEVAPAPPPALTEPVAPAPPPEPVAKPGATSGPSPTPHAEAAPKPQPKPETHAERAAKVEAILSGAASDKPENSAGGEFVVQLGAFGDPNNARSVQTRVKAQGYNAYTEMIKGKSGNQTRVRAGPFETREAAAEAASKLKQSGLAGVVAAK